MKNDENKTGLKHVRLKRLLGTREIKFRAWDGENMHYSDPTLQGSNGHLQLVTIYTGYEDSDEWAEYKYMQFTGLKDKNRNEIYEGDIIETREDDITDMYVHTYINRHVVVWGGKDYPAFDLKPSLNCTENGLSNLVCANEAPFFEVIGNVFENPELIL